MTMIREEIRELDRADSSSERLRSPLEERRIREILDMARELERELRRFQS